MSAELVADAGAELGEGPVWDDREHVLWWIDMAGSRLHRYDPTSGDDTSFALDREPGAVALRRGGGMVLAAESGFAALLPGEHAQPLARISGSTTTRMNDGKCDAAGRFYASSVSRTAEPGAGALWRLDPDLSVHCVMTGLTVGNGLGWSADGRTLYLVDSADQSIDAFAVDPATGALSGRRPVVRVPPEHGSPDGLCVDDEGCLWVALWGGSAVRRYTPSGEELVAIEMPVSRVTSLCFGGAALDELYVTTAWCELSDEQRGGEPKAGGLFRFRPGVTGPEQPPFAG